MGGDLPDPDSSLNKIVPSSAIAKANENVAPILPSAANHGRNVERGPHTKLMPASAFPSYGTIASMSVVS